MIHIIFKGVSSDIHHTAPRWNAAWSALCLCELPGWNTAVKTPGNPMENLWKPMKTHRKTIYINVGYSQLYSPNNAIIPYMSI